MSEDETAAEPPTEPIEGPAPTAAEDAPPSWLTDESDGTPAETEPKSAVSEADLIEGTEIFVEGISYLHDAAADATGYDGFRMTERRTKLWKRSLKFILRHVKVEKWPEYMALLWLGMDEGLMLIGYLVWRKNQKPREPTASEKK